MNEEIWKEIPGYPSYKVSNTGKVYSRKGNRLMKSAPNARGYHTVQFTESGKGKNFMVHRLVLMAFRPIPNVHEMQVDHINCIRHDNRLENLRWCTAQENVRFTNEAGRNPKKESHGRSELTEKDVRAIRYLSEICGVRNLELGKAFGVNPRTIAYVINGKTWKGIGDL